MSYPRFLLYNVTGGLFWVLVGVLAGWRFAEWTFVKENFSVVIIAIVIISVMPAVFEFLRHHMTKETPVT